MKVYRLSLLPNVIVQRQKCLKCSILYLTPAHNLYATRLLPVDNALLEVRPVKQSKHAFV